MSHKDGGPAFGGEIDDVFVNPEHPEIPPFHFKRRVAGMSLRDYFAAQAIPMATKWEEDSPTGPFSKQMMPTYTGIATRAYLMADALLKERAK